MTVENDTTPMNTEEPLDFKLELADKVRITFLKNLQFILNAACDHVDRRFCSAAHHPLLLTMFSYA